MSFLKRLFGIPEAPKLIDLEPIKDSLFGDLAWERTYRYWTGHVVFPLGGAFELNVQAASDTDPLPASSQRIAFEKIKFRLVELRDKAIEDYLPIFNSDGVEGEPYSSSELAAALVPGHIRVESDGDVEVAFYDTPEDLLGGHSLKIVVHPDGEVDIGLEG